MIKLQAHRGVNSECPENTLPSILAAIEQGYDVIELDVDVTKDMVFVLMHDGTINRTARRWDGSVIEERTEVGSVTYEELLEYDFGAYYSLKYVGTKVCLLEEALSHARNAGIRVKIDNKYRKFAGEQKEAFFSLLEKWQDTAMLTCATLEMLQEAADRFPDMHLHYDGSISEELLPEFSKIVSVDRLTIWMPSYNSHTAWYKGNFVNPEIAAKVREVAELGIWLLTDYADLELAESMGASIVETAGQLKPVRNQGILADMHTHSRNSHDASYPVMDICQAEIAAGVKIMAVADHCDVFMCTDNPGFDMYSNQIAAFREAKQVDSEVGDACKVLTGIELGEGNWYPENTKKVVKMLPYDVIVGATHAVKCPRIEGKTGMQQAFSQFPWETMPQEEIDQFFEMYFDEILDTVENVDIDIVAHIGCPRGYILRKGGQWLDLHPYEDKIRKILQVIIRRGIALEVQSSYLKQYGFLNPDDWILKMYKEMEGYLITLSTDAHSPARAGINFKEAVAMLKEIGFHNIFYFQNRRAYQCTI